MSALIAFAFAIQYMIMTEFNDRYRWILRSVCFARTFQRTAMATIWRLQNIPSTSSRWSKNLAKGFMESHTKKLQAITCTGSQKPPMNHVNTNQMLHTCELRPFGITKNRCDNTSKIACGRWHDETKNPPVGTFRVSDVHR